MKPRTHCRNERLQTKSVTITLRQTREVSVSPICSQLCRCSHTRTNWEYRRLVRLPRHNILPTSRRYERRLYVHQIRKLCYPHRSATVFQKSMASIWRIWPLKTVSTSLRRPLLHTNWSSGVMTIAKVPGSSRTSQTLLRHRHVPYLCHEDSTSKKCLACAHLWQFLLV